MDYKIALCDDEEALLRLVSGLVGEWAAARQTVCGIETFPRRRRFCSSTRRTSPMTSSCWTSR